MTLNEYVMRHTVRGACACGKCVDAIENPQVHQPTGRTANLTFFEVANIDGVKEEFLTLVRNEHPNWLDGEEHNYIAVGAEIGDQSLALMTIGLGHLLGVWEALSPDTIMPFLDKETKNMMAQQGMVALKARKRERTRYGLRESM